MSTTDGGVQVHVGVDAAAQQQKKGGEITTNTTACTNSSSTCNNTSCCSSPTCLWLLWVLGFVCPPLWWVGVAAGLRTGQDNECLIKRKKGLSCASTWAWCMHIFMTVLSALALILILAIFFGVRGRGPEQQGPYYLALAGPAATFPDLTGARQLSLLAEAVHAGLALPAAYSPTGIAVWVDSSTTVSPPAPGRRLLQDNETMQVSVLGYSLTASPELPSEEELAARVENGTAVDDLSEQLVAVGLVPEANVGQLSVGLLSLLGTNTSEKLAAMLERRPGNPAFNLVPVGKRCKGNWTEWSECVECGTNQTRTFVIPPRAADRDDVNTTSTTTTDDAPPASSRRLLKSNAQSDETEGAARVPPPGAGSGGNGHDKRPSQLEQGLAWLQQQAGAIVGAVGGFAGGAQQQQQQQPGGGSGGGNGGFAHALAGGGGLGQGLALALGRIECAVINGTVETRPCEACQAP